MNINDISTVIENGEVFAFTRKELARLRWVLRAVEKRGSRPVLQHINVLGQKIVAADGFRLHSAPAPQGFLASVHSLFQVQLLSAINKFTALVRSQHELRALETFAPNAQCLVPTTQQKELCSFAVNAQYLIDALSMPNDDIGVIVRLFASDKESDKVSLILVEGRAFAQEQFSKVSDNCFAIIMPMAGQIQNMKTPIEQIILSDYQPAPPASAQDMLQEKTTDAIRTE